MRVQLPECEKKALWIVYFFINMINFEIFKTERLSPRAICIHPSKSNFSLVCPFFKFLIFFVRPFMLDEALSTTLLNIFPEFLFLIYLKPLWSHFNLLNFIRDIFRSYSASYKRPYVAKIVSWIYFRISP